MNTIVKNIKELATEPLVIPNGWEVIAVINEDNLSYLAKNLSTLEAIWVDPSKDDWETLIQLSSELQNFRFLAVIDTHTHADHISCAGLLAQKLDVPLIMHSNAPSKKVSFRVSNDSKLKAEAADLEFLLTPGHTSDSLTLFWGPFIFTGDTILFGDTGRDDLPTGDPEAHYESLQKIKNRAKPDDIFLTGHDFKGGRVCYWKTQLHENASLSQSRNDFIQEAGSFVGKSPKLLKEALFENFK